uniref:Uncharacterized protein n=1 Tax=viral metagenome TaxID=1070528 RepID=A0A6H2A6F9_9ZZZZ
MSKTHKLTEVEQKHLNSVGAIIGALNSWGNTLEYLIGLTQKDRQNYVDTVVRIRLGIKAKKNEEVDMHVDAGKGTVEEL